jgi:hypothetical protein
MAFGDDDCFLPRHLQVNQGTWSRLLGSYLRNPKKVSSSLPNYDIIVRQTDGYNGLKFLISTTHPLFHACDTLSASYPQQKENQDIIAFYDEFKDCVSIMQVFWGSTISLTDKHTILFHLQLSPWNLSGNTVQYGISQPFFAIKIL